NSLLRKPAIIRRGLDRVAANQRTLIVCLCKEKFRQQQRNEIGFGARLGHIPSPFLVDRAQLLLDRVCDRKELVRGDQEAQLYDNIHLLTFHREAKLQPILRNTAEVSSLRAEPQKRKGILQSNATEIEIGELRHPPEIWQMMFMDNQPAPAIQVYLLRSLHLE